MELLDEWHPVSEGYKPMLPSRDNTAAMAKYDTLARMERKFFSWWCTLTLRPDSGRSSVSGFESLQNECCTTRNVERHDRVPRLHSKSGLFLDFPLVGVRKDPRILASPLERYWQTHMLSRLANRVILLNLGSSQVLEY